MHVSLIHTRLAIIDVGAAANQPFCRDHVSLVFNGEIYNYKELRVELESAGFVFLTNSDTEVLLVAYLKWGTHCLDRLEGMWAFALIDEHLGKILISRDRFGEKPLFYMRTHDTLYFASEINALAVLAETKPDINYDKARRFLACGFRFLHKTDDTFYQNVKTFPAASYAWIMDASEPLPELYWQLKFRPSPMAREDIISQTREVLSSALRMRLRADVPLAFCLSGGIDSSALTAISNQSAERPIHCFSVVDDDPRYDERDNIHTMVDALQCRHTEIHPERRGFFDRFSTLVADRGGPVPTINYFLHASLLEAIADNGFKISISGTGADEMFSGYYDHYAMWLAGMTKLVGSNPDIDIDNLVGDWRRGYGAHVRNPILQDPLVFCENPEQRDHLLVNSSVFGGVLKPAQICAWQEIDYCDELLRNRMLNELLHEIVPVILAADDRNAMRVSVENRSPFLDRKLVELLFTVPSKHLVHGGLAKSILREVITDLVPNSVRLDPCKRGFNASIESLLNRDDPQTRASLLDDGPIFDIVDRKRLEDILDCDSSANSYSKFLFGFLSTRAFLDTHQSWKPY